MISKNFSDLPSGVQEFLLDSDAVEWADQLAATYKLSGGDGMVLLEVVEETVLGITGLELLPASLMAETACDWETAKKIAVELAGVRLLPIASLVGDVVGQIKLWGGDPAKFSEIKPLDLPRFSAEDYVREALKEWNVMETDAVLFSRLVFILTSLVKGERTVEETKAVLLRSRKVGGMEFAEAVAARAIELTKKMMKKIPPAPSPSINVFRPDSRPLKKIADEGGGVQARKIDDIKPVVPLVASVAVSPLRAFSPSLPSHDRLPAAVFPRTETAKEEKQQPKKMEDFFQKTDEAEISQAAVAVKEKTAAVKPTRSVKEVVERLVQETGLVLPDNEFQKRFLAAVDSRWRGVRDAFGTRDVLEKSREQGGLGLSGIVLVKIMGALEKMVEEQNQTFRAEAVQKLKNQQDQKISAAKSVFEIEKKSGVGQAPKPKTAILSAASLPRPTVDGRPKVEDITFVRKLAGPIEELQNLSVEEFRRLASDPQEAATKLRDKIDLLEEQGIGKKLAGIKAWRVSPVNRLYLVLSKEALVSGRSLEEVCRSHRESGEAVFSSAELKAVASLNKDLRF